MAETIIEDEVVIVTLEGEEIRDPFRALCARVVARGVSLEDYMANYAALHHEWIEGVVIDVSPAEFMHNKLIYYLEQLLEAFFELRPIGKVVSQPFVMRLPEFPNRRREPDLLVVLDSNPHELTKTYMNGSADLVVEVVSEESIERDHGAKFVEYEKGGVPEYWIVDRIHRESRFYRLNDDGVYARQVEDSDGYYRTPTLPGLALHVLTLWQDKLPGPGATAAAVQAMLAQDE